MDKIDGDLYDKQIRVIFIGFIRPQLELKTIDELKKVIQNGEYSRIYSKGYSINRLFFEKTTDHLSDTFVSDIEQSTKALENSSAKELKTHNYFN